MRVRRMFFAVLVGFLVVTSGLVQRSSKVSAAGQMTASQCTPAPTGIPGNAGNMPTGHVAIGVFALHLPAGACHPNSAFGPNQCADPMGSGDTFPLGPGGLFRAGVFDTGSSVVVVNNVIDQTLAQQGGQSDTTYLEVCKPATANETSNCVAPNPIIGHDANLPLSLDVRIWGLGAVDAMGDITTGPQANVQFLQIRPSNAEIPTLIGAPVASNVIAQLNYGNILTRNLFFTTFNTPDITFYLPGDPGIPPMPYSFTLALQGFVGASPDDGANVGPRFLVASALVKKGTSTVANGTQFTFMYDTGNVTTLLTTAAAQALGIDPVNDVPVDCQTLDTVNGPVGVKGFMLDRFEMTTVDGLNRYVIHNPLVYVDPNLSLDNVGVLLGSNFFEPQAVQFDGPGKALRLSSAFSVADVNEDGHVDCADMAIIRASFGKRTGQAGFDPRADVNRDGIVNIYDLSFVSQRLPAGSHC